MSVVAQLVGLGFKCSAPRAMFQAFKTIHRTPDGFIAIGINKDTSVLPAPASCQFVFTALTEADAYHVAINDTKSLTKAVGVLPVL